MSVEVGTAYLTIVPSAKGFAGKLQSQVGGDVASAGKAAGLSFGNALKAGAIVGGLAIAGVGAAFASGLKAAADYQLITARTANVIKQTGGAANVSAKEIADLGGKIEGYSSFTNDAIESGANLLLTFTNIKNEAGAGNDIFTQTTSIMADLSQALGQDTKSSAIQLGKALNDPIKGVTALQRVGVSFTASQKDQIKTLVKAGDTLGAQKLILGELQKEFGGAAKAAGGTFAGSVERLKNQFSDLLRDAVIPLLPALTTIVGVLADNMVPAFHKVQDIATPVFASIGRLVSPVIDSLKELPYFLSLFTDGLKGFEDDAGSSNFGAALVAGGLAIGDLFTGTLLPAFETAKNYIAANFVPAMVAVSGVFTGTVLPALSVARDFVVTQLIPAFGKVAGSVRDLATTVGPIALEIGRALAGAFVDSLPKIQAALGFIASLVPPALALVATVVSKIADAISYFNQNRDVLVTVAAVITTILIPPLVQAAAAAVTSGIAQVTAWVSTQVAAVTSSAVSATSSYRVVAGWVAMGAAAIASGVETVAIWALYQAQALQGAATYVLAQARVVGAYVAMGAAAVAQGAVSAGAWIASSAQTVGALALQGAAFVAQKVVMAAGAVATGLLTAAQGALNFVLAANPIGLVVIAIAALVAGIIIAYKNSDTFRAIVDATWAAIMTAVSTVINFLAAAVPAVFQAIKSAFLNFTILGLVISHWTQIRNFIASAVANIGATIGFFASLPGKFAGWFGGVVTAVNGKIGELIVYVSGIPGRVVGALGNLAGSLYGVGRDLILGMVNGVRDYAGQIASSVTSAVGNAISSAKGLLGINSPSRVFMEIGRYTSEGMALGIDAGADKVQRAVKNMVPTASSANLQLAPFGAANAGAAAGAATVFTGPVYGDPLAYMAAAEQKRANRAATYRAAVAVF